MKRILMAGAAAALAVTITAPDQAQACGGFFCGQQPVDQTAERIVFAVNEDGTVDMITQISYRGDAETFAWILPVPEVPDVESLATFSQRALVGLDAQTGPSFQYPSDCSLWLDAAAGPPSKEGDGGMGGVDVHIRAEVGPYDVAVVSSEDPAALVAWLRDNGYRVTTPMEPYIRQYTAEGMKFLALKLLPGRDVTEIAPFRMTLSGQAPSIPLRLTALAAEPEMGVAVFILGDMRFGPANWPAVEIDDSQILWSPYSWPISTNWTALVARGVDEAGGQGWVTEMAGTTAPMVELLRASTPADEETRIATEELLSLLEAHPYVTRLYSRLSAEEMVSDPVFRRTDGGDVPRTRMLPRVVDGRDLCEMDPGGGYTPTDATTPCDFAACGAGGLCRVVDGGDTGPDIAGCACIPGTTARTTFDPAGRATVACQDMRMSFLNPGDREYPGATPLPDPCVGFSCGDHGRCEPMNMTPTCVCDEGFVATGAFDATTGARLTTCVTPIESIPASFYTRRLLPRPASLPGGREVDVPAVVPAGGAVCSASGSPAQGGFLALALGMLAIVLVGRSKRR